VPEASITDMSAELCKPRDRDVRGMDRHGVQTAGFAPYRGRPLTFFNVRVHGLSAWLVTRPATNHVSGLEGLYVYIWAQLTHSDR